MAWTDDVIAALNDIKVKADGTVAAIDGAWPGLDGTEKLKWGAVRGIALGLSWLADKAIELLD